MSRSQVSASPLFTTVVENGYCIGCGACAAFDPNIEIRFNRIGQYEAALADNTTPSTIASRVCPFADGNPDEDEIGKALYGDRGTSDDRLGYHLACYAGWVKEADYRTRGSSGGIASWLLNELLERNLVDYVVHVAPVAENNGRPLFEFAISSTQEAVRANSKSRYYPVEMSGVIQRVLNTPGRYAVTGIPCFIKALRLASRESPVLRERIAFTVGIVCGHLKSTAFADYFAWQSGIAPAELRAIDFRTKLPDRPASSYGVTVTGERNGEKFTVTKPTSELHGSNWGQGLFKYKACDFCDDVVAETADISIGDAWLPEYVKDASGTNVVVVRSEVLHRLITDAEKAGRLHLDSIPAAKFIESQAGGFRHRREGLAYRLHLEDQTGRWRPSKRIAAEEAHLTNKLKDIYRLRYNLALASHPAFAEAKACQNIDLFMNEIGPLAAKYDRHYKHSLPKRVLGKIKRSLLSLIRSQRCA